MFADESGEVTSANRADNVIGSEPSFDQSFDRLSLNRLNLGLVLDVLAEKRDVAVVVPEVRAVGHLDDRLKARGSDAPQGPNGAVREPATGLGVVAVRARREPFGESDDDRRVFSACSAMMADQSFGNGPVMLTGGFIATGPRARASGERRGLGRRRPHGRTDGPSRATTTRPTS